MEQKKAIAAVLAVEVLGSAEGAALVAEEALVAEVAEVEDVAFIVDEVAGLGRPIVFILKKLPLFLQSPNSPPDLLFMPLFTSESIFARGLDVDLNPLTPTLPT